MEGLWAPWRAEYILGPKEKECIFCSRLKQTRDRDNLILHRAKKSFIIMNLYPYNSGHLMVAPNAHKAKLDELTKAEYTEMFQLLTIGSKLLTTAMPADGLNIGINLGEVAGSSIKEHLHIHIVPRFTGDTNFMPVIGLTKVQSFALLETYDAFKKHLKKLLKS
ncbi:MAG: HIT domain-containing protein [candidate division Zixibacteria bacterium]|nr:HIT domain-containing protein [candidate division Zixibacteria bacterium]